MNLFLSLLLLIINYSFRDDSRPDFLATIRAEGEPVTFQVGGDTSSGTAFLAGVPGCFNGIVYELSDIL